MHSSGCRKCQKQWNRWFKRQLANWTVADLLNSVVTWSKDDHQLILPNYSDMPLGCRRQHVQSRFCCRIHFWTQATEHVSNSEKFQTRVPAGVWGKKLRGEGWKEGHWHLSPSQRHFAERWPCSNAEAICGFSQQRPCKTRHVLWFDLSQS